MFSRSYTTQSGKAMVYVLVALVIVALGALGYLSTQMDGFGGGSGKQTAATEQAQQDSGQAQQDSGQAKHVEIVPGNPVVAKVGGAEIKRDEIFAFIQTLPPQTRKVPLDQLFPLALEQVVNAKIIQARSQKVNLDNDPDVKKRLAEAKKQIVQTVFVQNEMEKRLTEDRIRKAYDEYVSSYTPVEEVKAAHILVDDEATANEILAKLNDGGDFAALAKEYSKDTTAQKGGQLDYFTKKDVVPAFGEVAFSMLPGTISKEPVKSRFGYHIIRVDDKRERDPVAYEQAKPLLEAQLRKQILDELVSDWREAASVERFNINGQQIEPAAGGE